MTSFRNSVRMQTLNLPNQLTFIRVLIVPVLVVVLGLWLRIAWTQWPPLLLAVALVWMAEFINSALEAIVDLASPGRHPLARVGKDVGAAAVLIAALAAAAIGLIILLPPLTARLGLGG